MGLTLNNEIMDQDHYKWYIICVIPQQKVKRVIRELLDPECKNFIKEVYAPTKKTSIWKNGLKRTERETLAVNNYFYIEATDYIFQYSERIKKEADCKLQIWHWQEGASEINNIKNQFDNQTAENSYKVGQFVEVPKLGLRGTILEIKTKNSTDLNNNLVKSGVAVLKVFIMDGCEPVKLDVSLDDIKLSEEEWEEV